MVMYLGMATACLIAAPLLAHKVRRLDPRPQGGHLTLAILLIAALFIMGLLHLTSVIAGHTLPITKYFSALVICPLIACVFIAGNKINGKTATHNILPIVLVLTLATLHFI